MKLRDAGETTRVGEEGVRNHETTRVGEEGVRNQDILCTIHYCTHTQSRSSQTGKVYRYNYSVIASVKNSSATKHATTRDWREKGFFLYKLGTDIMNQDSPSRRQFFSGADIKYRPSLAAAVKKMNSLSDLMTTDIKNRLSLYEPAARMCTLRSLFPELLLQVLICGHVRIRFSTGTTKIARFLPQTQIAGQSWTRISPELGMTLNPKP